MNDDVKGESKAMRYDSVIQRVYPLFYMLLVAIIAAMIAPKIGTILDNINQGIEIRNEAINKIPDIETKLTEIELKVNGFNKSDLGERLNVVESMLQTKELNVSDIKTLGGLTSDIKRIDGLLGNNVGKVIEIKEMHERTEKISEIEKDVLSLKMLERDLSNFKTTIYLIAGFLFTILFGSWAVGKKSGTVTKAGN